MFGWYDTKLALNGQINAAHTIFSGPTGPTTSTVFIPADNYGFWFENPSNDFGGPAVWATQSDKNINTTDNSGQHFAVFSDTDKSPTGGPGTNSQTYWIGMEDEPFHHSNGSTFSDKDYNDMVVEVTPAAVPAVPEPATMLLLGSGLIGLAGFARKKFKK